MNIFDDDPTENAEDKMSDAILEGCLLIGAVALVLTGLIATLAKVWS